MGEPTLGVIGGSGLNRSAHRSPPADGVCPDKNASAFPGTVEPLQLELSVLLRRSGSDRPACIGVCQVQLLRLRLHFERENPADLAIRNRLNGMDPILPDGQLTRLEVPGYIRARAHSLMTLDGLDGEAIIAIDELDLFVCLPLMSGDLHKPLLCFVSLLLCISSALASLCKQLTGSLRLTLRFCSGVLSVCPQLLGLLGALPHEEQECASAYCLRREEVLPKP